MLQSIMSQYENDSKPTAAIVAGEIQDMEMGHTYAEELEAVKLSLSADVIDNVVDTLEVASASMLNATGGYDAASANAILKTAAVSAKLIGFNLEIPAGESFDEESRAETTRIQGEALGEKAGNAMKVAKEYISKALDSIVAFFKKHLSKLGRLTKNVEAAQEKYKDLAGKIESGKDKVKMNLAPIWEGSKAADANGVSKDAVAVKAIAKLVKAAAGQVKSGETITLEVAGAKAASDDIKKASGMGEGYASVMASDVMLGGDVVVVGQAAEGKKSRATVVGGKLDKKKTKAEFSALSIAEVKSFLGASKEQLEAAVEIVEAGDELAAEIKKAITAAKDAGKDAGKEEKEAAKELATKLKASASFATELVRMLSGHCTSAAGAAFNYANKSAKLYKEEAK